MLGHHYFHFLKTTQVCLNKMLYLNVDVLNLLLTENNKVVKRYVVYHFGLDFLMKNKYRIKMLISREGRTCMKSDKLQF